MVISFEKSYFYLTSPPQGVVVAIPINPDAVINGLPISVAHNTPVVQNDEAIGMTHAAAGTFLNLNKVVWPAAVWPHPATFNQ